MISFTRHSFTLDMLWTARVKFRCKITVFLPFCHYQFNPIICTILITHYESDCVKGTPCATKWHIYIKATYLSILYAPQSLQNARLKFKLTTCKWKSKWLYKLFTRDEMSTIINLICACIKTVFKSQVFVQSETTLQNECGIIPYNST